MYAQLGSVIFENLKSFNTYSQRGTANFAEHALIDSKPRLQATGLSLREISLNMRFHASFCNPTHELKALKDYRDTFEILPLLFGNGTLGGSFVITDLNEEVEDADTEGNVFSYVIYLTLKEFVTKDKLQQEQEFNRKNATAVGDKKPVAKKKANPKTCPQIVSGIITRIENHAAQINSIVLTRGGANSVENKNSIKSHLIAISKLCGDLLQRDADPQSCVHAFPDIGKQAANVRNEVPLFQSELNDPASTKIPTENAVLQNRVKLLKSAARPLINQAITRNG